MRASSRHVLRAASPDPQTQACTQPAPLLGGHTQAGRPSRAASPRVTYPRFLHLFRDFRFIFLERQEEEKQVVTVAGSPGGTREPRQHAPGQGGLAAKGAVAAASAVPRGAPCSPSRMPGRVGRGEPELPQALPPVDPSVPIATGRSHPPLLTATTAAPLPASLNRPPSSKQVTVTGDLTPAPRVVNARGGLSQQAEASGEKTYGALSSLRVKQCYRTCSFFSCGRVNLSQTTLRALGSSANLARSETPGC